MTATATMTDCAICIEKFNASRRKRVVCPYCPTDGTDIPYCLTCAKTYILQDDAPSPRCAACRSGWTEDYMTQTFAKSWLLKDYKAHRERVLLDMERARLPEAQDDAARYRRAKGTLEHVATLMKPIKDQLDALPEVEQEQTAFRVYKHAWRRRRDMNEIQYPVEYAESRNAEHRAWTSVIAARNNLARARQPLNRALGRIYGDTEYRNASYIVQSVGLKPPQTGRRGAAGAGANEESTRSRWTFVMKCPLEACEGFVGTNWKCGLCEVTFCKDCGERVAAEGHACETDTASTFTALRKEAKPCPKCAAMISKIDGCDQMWCTQCQTAFSWRTGQVETSHVHNPHYFQWLRQNGGDAAHVPLRHVGDCLNLTADETIEQGLHYALNRRNNNDIPRDKRTLYFYLVEWIRLLRHYMGNQRYHQSQLRNKQNDEWRRRLRVQRLVNEITDAQWKDRLQRGEKATQKIYAVTQVLDLYIQASLDLVRASLPDDADIAGINGQLETLRTFCNAQMLQIQARYNNDVPHFMRPDEELDRERNQPVVVEGEGA